MATYVVTGGAGFIGSNFVRYMLESDATCRVVVLDALTYAGNLASLSDIESDPRYEFHRLDISDREAMHAFFSECGDVSGVINFAAESHVDRSIHDSTPFVVTNILGVQILLDCVKQYGIPKFVQVSTDEVYGSLGAEGLFTESTPISPNSPYAASKASADLLVRSYFETFGLPVVTTRCSNNYGPYQFPEKLIPLMCMRAMEDQSLPVYGDGQNVRDWIHVQDHCRGVALALEKGRPGDVYNFGGASEMTNIELVRRLLQYLDKPESLIEFVTDRLGHDFRYAIDFSKAEQELGWVPKISFEDGLKSTIDWYRDHSDWTDEVKSGDYQQYYDRNYGNQRSV